MSYSTFASLTSSRTAAAFRGFLFHRAAGALFTLALMLVLGTTLVASPHLQAQPQAEAAVTTVNINTADALTLAAKLKGVGDSRAQEIVRYREAYGPFKSADELMEVKGIGQSTLDTNRAVITLE